MTRDKQYVLLKSLICGLVVFAVHGQADTLFNFTDFSSTAGLTLAGNAATASTSDGKVLRVTPTGSFQSGAAYSTAAVPLGAGDTFSTQFQFRITDPGGINPADGITFVLAANPNGLGAAGGGLGYSGVPNSVAVEFDTFNNGGGDGNSSNHVAIDENGNLSNLAFSNVYGNADCTFGNNSVPGCMSNGQLWTANINFDGSQLSVSLKDSSEGSAFTAISNFPIDIASLIGSNTAFVGFTAGTGSGWENQDILNWEFANTATLPVTTSTAPEPGTLFSLGGGLLGLFALNRGMRRRV